MKTETYSICRKQNKPSAHDNNNGKIHLLIKERMIFDDEKLKSILQRFNLRHIINNLNTKTLETNLYFLSTIMKRHMNADNCCLYDAASQNSQIIGRRMAITVALVSKEIQAFQNFSGYIFTNNKKIQKERSVIIDCKIFINIL